MFRVFEQKREAKPSIQHTKSTQSTHSVTLAESTVFDVRLAKRRWQTAKETEFSV